MRTALMQLLSDFLSAILFLILYGTTENLYLATGGAILVSLGQFAVSKIRNRPVDATQWLVLGMVVVLGSATLITQDSRFIMVKPSIVHFAVGAVMLRRGWMMRYLPPIVRDNIPDSVLLASGYAWRRSCSPLESPISRSPQRCRSEYGLGSSQRAPSAPRSLPSSCNTRCFVRSCAGSSTRLPLEALPSRSSSEWIASP